MMIGGLLRPKYKVLGEISQGALKPLVDTSNRFGQATRCSGQKSGSGEESWEGLPSMSVLLKINWR
jgi:hypothetical protein